MLKTFFTGAVVFILIVFITMNVEEVVKKHGWDQFFSRLADAMFSDITQLPHHWLWLLLAFFIGGATALWLNVLLEKVHIIRPNIPTSVQLQFTAGSNQVTQIANENVNNTLSERALFNFEGEDGELLGQKMLWYIFITFNKPTQYGQIVVDAGNAAIPPWQVISHKNFSAIVRFDGDIGNVALTIKTIPANQEN
jgi:hypothetical protein